MFPSFPEVMPKVNIRNGMQYGEEEREEGFTA
jgi:hypothetical protein